MISRVRVSGWCRSGVVWIEVCLLAASIGVAALVTSTTPRTDPEVLRQEILARMRTTLEQVDPTHHGHAGHTAPQGSAGEQAAPAVVCGVHVYGYEPTGATTLADVRTVYGFHLCGVAEQKRHWDGAVKLVGPLIMDMTTRPPGVEVVEATADVRFVDRLREMFPDKYEDLALREALPASEMADLRRRYDAAAGL
ncbi:hypothetical protein GA0070622_2948 [Micromonospora sediminicola]|uniref:Uncharacterized protein n=1 Tax=Micromonospora sediminicola TaxID=946078 RepID=A0A1A9BAL2_9ACTN|nr:MULTISPECIES: hypothetical protein [Micromonospora]PGH42919.1 hypothetical protein COO58_19180 [Micromonospora sp. WMMA1996]SBT65932.1 hypothetical protein GA0070622_2948 [Micromonospora sediminicola]